MESNTKVILINKNNKKEIFVLDLSPDEDF